MPGNGFSVFLVVYLQKSEYNRMECILIFYCRTESQKNFYRLLPPVRRMFMKKTKRMSLLVLFILLIANVSIAAAASTDWTWISSDSKYGKFFAPERIRVVTSVKDVPVEIEAWTKTVYTYEGAAETINNYGIASVIPNPASLNYSLARVVLNPQNRTLTYAQEIFYDSKGNVLWSKNDAKVTAKEINSRAFDQDFYCIIVDQVFKMDEFSKISASDRWLTLWQENSADGGVVVCWADTASLRMHGENAVVWVWEDTRNPAGVTTEIRYRKKAYNLSQGTAKVIRYDFWSDKTGWTKKEDDLENRYYSIIPDSNEDVGARVLKQYVETHKDWAYRYAISEDPITVPAPAPAPAAVTPLSAN